MPRYTKKTTQQAGSDGTAYLTVITSPWMLAFGAGTNGLRILDELRGLTGNYRQKVCWRTAAVVTDIPDAWNYSANVHSTNDVFTEDFTPTSGKLWVQAGLACSASSGSGEALASLQAGVGGQGHIAATGSFSVQPDLNATQTAYYLVGDPFPVLGLSSVMFGVILDGVSGTLTWQPAIRYLDRADDAGGWTDLWSPQSPNANTRDNSGGLSISPGTKMFAQAGIKVTTAARGEFDVIVAAF